MNENKSQDAVIDGAMGTFIGVIAALFVIYIFIRMGGCRTFF